MSSEGLNVLGQVCQPPANYNGDLDLVCASERSGPKRLLQYASRCHTSQITKHNSLRRQEGPKAVETL
jgi:hypothetical protein